MMEIEFVDGGELDLAMPGPRNTRVLWRLRECWQPVIDGDPHPQIRVHRSATAPDIQRQFWASCAITGLRIWPPVGSDPLHSRTLPVELAIQWIAGIPADEWQNSINEYRIPGYEFVHRLWYPRSGMWLHPGYPIRHDQTSNEACTIWGQMRGSIVEDAAEYVASTEESSHGN